MLGHAQLLRGWRAHQFLVRQQVTAIQVFELLGKAPLEFLHQPGGTLLALRAVLQCGGIAHAKHHHGRADHAAHTAAAHTVAEAAGQRDALLLGQTRNVRKSHQHALSAAELLLVILVRLPASFHLCHDSFLASSMIFRIR